MWNRGGGARRCGYPLRNASWGGTGKDKSFPRAFEVLMASEHLHVELLASTAVRQ